MFFLLSTFENVTKAKKIIIISYFFMPCNLTASQRAYSWAKYLNKFGYYPIIITRKWERKIKSFKDCHYPTSDGVDIERHDHYEVHYTPYKANLRDRLHIQNRFRMLRRFLSLFEIIFQNFSFSACPSSKIYFHADEIIQENSNISAIIVSGNPFIQFRFGFHLNKNHNIPWIADYRDDWTTTELSYPQGAVARKLFKMDQKSELKWVGTASLITSVSEYYVNKISHFVGVKGEELLNGYDEKIEELPAFELAKDRFIITYNGTLYPSQKIEPLLEVLSELIQHFKDKIRIELRFPGLDYAPDQGRRVRNSLKDVLDHVTITDRVSRDKVLEMQRESHLLLMIAHEGIKGIPSSKLYEYIGLQKPVLLYPSDNDIIEKTLKDCCLGIICEDETDIENKLSKFIKDFILNGENSFSGDMQKIDKYHRKQQVKKLATLLDKL